MKNLRGANISQKRGSKGPVERSIERKNMQPIKIDPELSKAYQRHAKEEVHEGDANGTKQKCLFSSDAVSERSIQNDGEPVHERHDRLKYAQLRILPSEEVSKDWGDGGVVVPRHVEERVEESERQPVDNALLPEVFAEHRSFQCCLRHR